MVDNLAKHNQPLSEQYRLVAEEYVDAYAGYRAMEESKATVLANIKQNVIDQYIKRDEKCSDAQAEREARCSHQWKEFLELMSRTNKRRLDLQVKRDVLKMRHSEQMSSEANVRRERGM